MSCGSTTSAFIPIVLDECVRAGLDGFVLGWAFAR